MVPVLASTPHQCFHVDDSLRQSHPTSADAEWVVLYLPDVDETSARKQLPVLASTTVLTLEIFSAAKNCHCQLCRLNFTEN